MRVVLYTGKGGVGKTTTAAATAACAAAHGRRTLVLSADAAHSLGDVLGHRLGAEPVAVAPRLHALEVDARAELARHWESIRAYLVDLFRHQGIEELVAEELALLPGAEEVAALLVVEREARSGRWDLLVVDCAPTGSTLRLVTLPDMARGAFRVILKLERALATVVTPLARAVAPVPLPGGAVFRDAEQLLYRRLREVQRRLTAPTTSVRLVVTPERMVIDEARRAWTDLSLFEIRCDAVVMNRLLPEEAAHEEHFRDWARVQTERCQEVEDLFAPLPVLRAPLRPDEVMGVEALAAHGEALFADGRPDALLARTGGIRFESVGDGGRVSLPLPHAERDALEVAKLDGELVIRSGARRRRISLPRRLARLSLAGARLRADRLVVRFAPGEGGGA